MEMLDAKDLPDGSVLQASQAGLAAGGHTQPEFNPFNGQNVAPSQTNKNQNYSTAPPPQSTFGSTPGGGGSGYAPAPWENKAAVEELEKRQAELERRAADLEKREQEMQRNVQAQQRINNFPPLPSICPVKPCFYQDFSVDIPLEFQKLVRVLYYGWIAYAGLLLLNIIGSLAYFAATESTHSNYAGQTFGLSILYAFLFTPCSFVCWFRPIYNAFRNDSSFNFFVFFFIFFFQFCVCIIQCISIDGWGTVGIINSLNMFQSSGAGGKGVAGFMFVIGILFGLMAAFDMVMLIRIHRIYRSSGASFAKAQSEFAQGVMSNPAVRQAAGNVAASAARETVNQATRAS